LLCFALDGGGNRRIMKYDDSFGRSQLRHGALEFQSLINARANKSLDLLLAKGGSTPRPNPPTKLLVPAKPTPSRSDALPSSTLIPSCDIIRMSSAWRSLSKS